MSTSTARPKLDFRGKWITSNNYAAEVRGQFCGYWVGEIKVGIFIVPTFWDKNGNSSITAYTLIERILPGKNL